MSDETKDAAYHERLPKFLEVTGKKVDGWPAWMKGGWSEREQAGPEMAETDIEDTEDTETDGAEEE
jgi:hypothetical protein